MRIFSGFSAIISIFNMGKIRQNDCMFYPNFSLALDLAFLCMQFGILRIAFRFRFCY